MPQTPDPLEEFPRQVARTRGFSLGVPRSFTVSPEGERVVFLRTTAGDDPVSCLWVLDVASGVERPVFDPRSTGAKQEDEGSLTPAERARRERARERSTGVTEYATDREVRRAVFAMSGRLFLADLPEAITRELSVPGPVDDPRLDAAGERIAYVIEGALHVREIEGGGSVLASDDEPDVTWGLAEFVAAEEMHRRRGHWWSPDGSTLAAARVDERNVNIWYIADQTDPAAPPRAVRYPQAGTEDAIVTLHLFDVASGVRTDVTWDAATFPYLGRFHWSEGGAPLLVVVSRDQRRAQLLEVDPATGGTTLVREDEDPEWVDLVLETPLRTSDGRVVTVSADRETDSNRLELDGAFVTPSGLQVRGVPHAGDEVLFRASDDPTEIHLWRLVPGADPLRLTEAPGVHSGTTGGGTSVVISATLEDPLPSASVVRDDLTTFSVNRVAETPVVQPLPRFLSLGERELRAALLLPGGREPDGPLPVLMDPYGGPHGARVLKSAGMFLTSQWIADHGFAILVVDGRGVDGRGPAWDREVKFDFGVTVEDQVDALHAAAQTLGFLDLERVGIRGWSFGGELAAMAVLRRPDVFHAAVIGAPVTDQRLYDTYYTERYMGHPVEHPEAYDRNSPLLEAASLQRPALLIHGLADDNVFVANTLKLSAALFEAGKPHELVLIPNATHLTRSTAVTENLLRVQLDFLRRTIGAP
jgi:dipeptidyl-peptidase-4